MGEKASLNIELHQLELETQGRYRFQRLLGRGAYGIVLEAFENETQTQVAIKRVERIFESTLDTKRILREIKILSQLSHENITNLYDVTTAPSFQDFQAIILVMDMMETDLYQVINSNQNLLVVHYRYFVYQILRGLKYIHSANILHRDLKPSNLLVNGNCDLKICDFGLARVANEDDPGDFLTEYVATRWYRAPEILLNYDYYGPPLDIWSLGCIMAEMLLKRPLFPGKSTMNQLTLITKILGSPTASDMRYCTNPNARKFMESLPITSGVPFEALFPDCDPDMIDLIRGMLQWDPENRLTVEDALNHPFLEEWHDPFDEPVIAPIAPFDFEGTDLSAQELKLLLWNEICMYHPEFAESE